MDAKLSVYISGSGDITPQNTEGGIVLSNIKSILSAGGKWSIDESGNIVAQTIKADQASLKKIELEDEVTGDTYCVRMNNGALLSTLGNCSQIAGSTAEESGNHQESDEDVIPNGSEESTQIDSSSATGGTEGESTQDDNAEIQPASFEEETP